MNKRRSFEELSKYTNDDLKKILLTIDCKGREVKEDALNILTERGHNTIFVITKMVRGPAGHGEPGQPYIALATEGNPYEIGTPLKAFYNYEDAEKYLKDNPNKQYWCGITAITMR